MVELLLSLPTLPPRLRTCGMVYYILSDLEEERMIVFYAELVSLVVLAASYDLLVSWTLLLQRS